MSIVRRGQDGSDVYVYRAANGNWVCQCGDRWHAVPTAQEMIRHLKNSHVVLGHCVPPYALDPETYRNEPKD